jgi:hypothetical protein
MADVRSRYGLTVSALGAIVLVVSVFLPWYRAGLAVHGGVGAAAATQFTVLSGHDALRELSVVLLVVAALAMLDSLLPLARTGAPLPGGAGGAVVLLGIVAALLVLYRMVDPPMSSAGELLSPSVRVGAWLALLGSVMMALGGIWPRCVYSAAGGGADARAGDAWSGLPGWTVGG